MRQVGTGERKDENKPGVGWLDKAVSKKIFPNCKHNLLVYLARGEDKSCSRQVVIRITLAYWVGGILPYVFKNAFAFPSVLSCSFLRIDRQRRWIFHILPQTVWQDDGVQPDV